MNKQGVVIIILMVFTGFIFSQSIEVTDPKEDETVAAGAAYTIKWTKSGSMHGSVKIRLFNAAGTTRIRSITSSTANDGSYTTSRSAFDRLPAGSYIIRVKTLDNLVSDDSEVFYLRPNTLTQTTKKPVSRPSISPGKDSPKTNLLPYIKSAKASAVPRPVKDFWPGNLDMQHYYRHGIEVETGYGGKNRSQAYKIAVHCKKRGLGDRLLESPLTQGPFQLYSGKTQKDVFVFKSYLPGVFENKVELFDTATEKILDEKTFYHKVTGVPDLRIWHARGRQFTQIGTPFKLKFRVSNIGYITTPACNIGIYVGRDLVLILNLKSLTSSESTVIQSSFPWHWEEADVFVYVDYLKKVPEFTELNNVIYQKFWGTSKQPGTVPRPFRQGEDAYKIWKKFH